MGYSGLAEVICITGHYACRETNGYEEEDLYTKPCKVCGGAIQYNHEVFITNGYVEDKSYTCCMAPKIETGFTDLWKEDHYGNKYAEKHLTYQPDLKVLNHKKKPVWYEEKL